jgi:hypothetical protein
MELVEDNFYQDQFLLMIWSLGEQYSIGSKSVAPPQKFNPSSVGMGNE